MNVALQRIAQLLAQPHDLVLDLARHRVRAAMRAPGQRLDRGLALAVVPAQQLVHPPSRYPVVPGDLADRSMLGPHPP